MTAFQPQPKAAGFADAIGASYASIRRERRPLPAHDLSGGNYRRWAVAVCMAEIKHAADDFWSLASDHGVLSFIDRYTDSDCHARYRLPHEIYAGAALNWISHIQTHDSDRCGPWERWSAMGLDEKRGWLQRRRYLLHGFLRQVAKYRAARSL